MTKEMFDELITVMGNEFVRTNANGVKFYYEIIRFPYSTTIVRVNRTTYKGRALTIWDDPAMNKVRP